MVKLLVIFVVGIIVVDLAMASDKPEAMVVERCSSSTSSCSTPSPTEVEAVQIRKLGPSMAPESEKKWRSEIHEERTDNYNSVKQKKHSQHSIDKSITGGGVILGGLATTFLVAVFCYIRATARHHKNGDSPSSP